MAKKLIINGKTWGEFEKAAIATGRGVHGNIELTGYRTYGGTHTIRPVEGIELTDNQTLVFGWLMIEGVHSDLLEMISELAFLNSTGGKMKWKRVSNAWLGLSDKERYEVLIAFAQRGFKKC